MPIKKVLFVYNYEERWTKGGDPIRQGRGYGDLGSITMVRSEIFLDLGNGAMTDLGNSTV